MGGMDKGLLEYRGRPLIEHVWQLISPQVDDVVISANRNPEHYARLGVPVLADADNAFRGPLAGLAAAFAFSGSPLLVSVPCDTPNLPSDLVQRLFESLGQHDVAVAATRDGSQNVIALYRSRVAERLAGYMANGGRKVADWQAGLSRIVVEFDDSAAFVNLNSPQDLLRAESNGP